MNFNKAFVLGNLTRNPELKALPSGQSVVNFGLATNRFYTDKTGQKKQDAEFHNIVAFGKLADTCSRYLTTGSMLLVEGRIKTRSWQNAQGVKQYKTEIIAENIQLGPRTAGQGFNKTQNVQPNIEKPETEEIPIIEESYVPPAPKDDTGEQNAQTPPPDDSDEVDIKDIPF